MHGKVIKRHVECRRGWAIITIDNRFKFIFFGLVGKGGGKGGINYWTKSSNGKWPQDYH